MSNRPYELALAKIKRALEKHPHVAASQDETSFTVSATEENGYDVTLQDNGEEIILYAGHYHEHFEDPDEAFACIMWMLTPVYRVVETRRGKHTVGAVLERVCGDSVEQLGRFHILLPIFGRMSVHVLQNHHLPIPDKAESPVETGD